MANKYILLVEDMESMAAAYMEYLRKGPFDVTHVASGQMALKIIQERQPLAVILDIQLPDSNGLDVLRTIRAGWPDIVVIMITAHGSVEKAVEAMRIGAYDFIMKPFPAARLLVTLRNALEKHSLQIELAERRAGDGNGFGPFIGHSPAMQAVYRALQNIAASKAPVFIMGESGTGKELAAQALHQNSPRRNGPFKAINCGAIPGNLLESALFGHVKGAFTDAHADSEGAIRAADGGTLFLDEICEMPLELQVKLLRVLQTQTVQPVGSNKEIAVDVRIIAATNRDPQLEVKAGNFREDLFYRLFVVPVELPPLRVRGEDIDMLARHFLQRYAAEEKKKFRGFRPELLKWFRGYAWPGNVRQLENCIRYMVALENGGELTLDDLPPQVLNQKSSCEIPVAGRGPVLPLRVAEQQSIRAALAATQDDVAKAAALLEINPSTIYRKLQAWERASA
ncbi:MAG: sigma-54-dependent transcriptional regulator [Bdellovibrionales bacterium]